MRKFVFLIFKGNCKAKGCMRIETFKDFAVWIKYPPKYLQIPKCDSEKNF